MEIYRLYIEKKEDNQEIVEIRKNEGTFKRNDRYNYHLMPKDIKCVENLSDSISKKLEGIKQNISDCRKDNVKIRINTSNGKEYFGLYNYLRVSVNNIRDYDLMCFRMAKRENEVQCVIQSIQYEVHTKKFKDNKKIYPENLNNDKGIAENNKHENFYYNPDISFFDDEKKIANSFMNFIEENEKKFLPKTVFEFQGENCLKNFVDKCNKCTYIQEDNKNRDEKARKLAEDIYLFKDCKDTALLEKVSDSQNREFIKCLLLRKDSKKYEYIQAPGVVAEIDPFNPYISEKKLNQKWHILIGLLAFLDTANNDPNYQAEKFSVKNQIEKIELNNCDKRWKLIINSTKYSSYGMCEWISHACTKNVAFVKKNYINEKQLYVVRKEEAIQSSSPHLLKLNRTTKHLEYYRLSTDNAILHDYYPIRKDFDASDYLMYEKEKEFPCIWGGGDTPTPEGIFQIEKVSEAHEEYVSGYYTGHDKVKFFGYLVVFEDYFIHSNLYTEEATQDTFEQMKPVNGAEEHSSGCIRLTQEDLDWLVKNVEVGTTVVM